MDHFAGLDVSVKETKPVSALWMTWGRSLGKLR
jgi:hypothetical protein